MTQRKSLVFDVLNKSHDYTDFSCGIEALDVYLKDLSMNKLDIIALRFRSCLVDLIEQNRRRSRLR